MSASGAFVPNPPPDQALCLQTAVIGELLGVGKSDALLIIISKQFRPLIAEDLRRMPVVEVRNEKH